MKLAVLRETAPGERRVAASPETVRKFIALGASVSVEAGAGVSASVSDAEYEAAGAEIGSRDAALQGADALLAVQGPDPASLAGLKPGALVVAALTLVMCVGAALVCIRKVMTLDPAMVFK